MRTKQISVEEKRIQKLINKFRKEGVTINVSHDYGGDEGGYDETVISVAFSNKYDAMDVSDEIRENLSEDCDSGAGFGWRDLQLCRLLPNLV